MDSARIDKWLWASRFFKTRQLAQKAIEGGKVHLNGQRTKPGKTVKIGDYLTIRQGFAEKIIQVEALSVKRGPATVAQRLYTETQQSINKREKETLLRSYATNITPNQKPDKKQRRQLIRRFKRQDDV